MKFKMFLTVLTALALIVVLTGNAGNVSAEAGCDPAFVTQSGNVLTIMPNGVDDTADLQCAFDEALAVGAGARVQLSAGLFHTAQVVVNGFDGTFAGTGMNATVIINLPNLYVTPVDMHLNPPSASNPWPSLFSFVDGNITISNLAIKVLGDNPTMGWTVFGIEPYPTEMAVGVAFLGTETYAKVDGVLMEGEHMENSLYGYNLINGIYFEGYTGELPWPPNSGSFEVYNSIFRRLASPTPVLNVKDTTVIISHNLFEDVFDASDASDIVNTSIIFTHNQVNGALFGYWVYPGWASNSGSKIWIKNNIFRSTYGVVFDSVYGAGNECLIMGNNVQNVTDVGIYLGPDVTGCTVVGGKSKTNVLDLGTGNILVGVNNMGTGVGPTISDFLRMKRP